MADAKRDNNQVPVILVTSNADGSTPVMVKVDPTQHSVDVNDGATGSDLSGDTAARDNNMVPVMMAVSSADGITPVPIYGDPSNGQILIKST